MKKLLLATSNPGKIKEYRLLLKELPLKLVSLRELGIKEKFEENKKTLEENAKEKAEFYSKLSKLPTIADDSGLEIDILKGEPGARSRRWLGYEAKDRELIDFALKKLKGIPWKKRGAQLRTILALGIPGRGRTSVFIFEGKIRGIIAEKPKGKLIKGYPFRLLFYLPKFKKTFAELGLKKEIEIGHRKEAIKKLIPVLKKIRQLAEKINFDFGLAKLMVRLYSPSTLSIAEGLTLFERKVLREVEKIPCGKTKTYQEIAGAISKPKAARAVGGAISKNPLPLIIPCHRVVGKKDIGGYIFGRKIKKYLLDSEKFTLLNNPAKVGLPARAFNRVKKFLNCKIDVSKKVFQPRTETEFWVKSAIQEIESRLQREKIENLKILDIFAGSGAVGIAVLKNVKNVFCDFVDIEEQALSQIKINLEINKIEENRYQIIKSDLFEKIKKRYDFILANPPYVATTRIAEVQKSVLEEEPHLALFAGKDGLDYIKKFLNEVKNRLKPEAMFYMEFDPLQKTKIEQILAQEGLKSKFYKDQFKKWRFLIGWK